MYALEMDLMTYSYEIDWSLSSMLTIEAEIQQFPFLE